MTDIDSMKKLLSQMLRKDPSVEVSLAMKTVRVPGNPQELTHTNASIWNSFWRNIEYSVRDDYSFRKCF